MPELALFVTGSLIMLVVVAGCLKLGRAEEEEARKRVGLRRDAADASRVERNVVNGHIG